MKPLSTDETCPVNLHYAEPEPVRLDLTSIIGRGERVRRRRRLARAGTAILACAVLAGTLVVTRGGPATWFPGHSRPAASASGSPIAALVAAHPPVGGKPTLLSRWPRNWTTVAWATWQGDVCWATARIPMHGATEENSCPGWTRADIPGPGRQGLSPLLPGILPQEDGVTDGRPGGGGNRVPEFGLVSPRAVRVVLTFLGHTFTARVVYVPVRGGSTIGAFMVWFTLPRGVSSYTGADITREIAYDAAGHIVARHGPWS